MTTQPKDPKTGRFTKGTSGNPTGRPLHSRNRSTVLMEALLQGEAEQLIRKAIELAAAGDTHALKLCLERLVPPRKDRSIDLRLPRIENPQQVATAIATVVKAIGNGRITPSEGETLANILSAQNEVLTTGDLERRIERLEQAQKAGPQVEHE